MYHPELLLSKLLSSGSNVFHGQTSSAGSWSCVAGLLGTAAGTLADLLRADALLLALLLGR
jgi:hypothetical protein